ncbi:MAG TPA: TonB-dependent receptor [Terriglobales bacterium]|nr:TonB-dependent receptor [Terriglobales bacterium]
MNTRRFVLLVSLLLLATPLTFAQGSASGDLHVSVKDQKGSAIANATVTVQEQEKATQRSTSNNATGEYSLLALPPGKYKVTVEAPGFAKVEVPNVTITVGQSADLPLVMAVAGTQEVVSVSSEAELVETTRTSSTDTIGQRQIDNLPINGRNYINFTLTDSQVTRDNAPNTGAAPTSGLNFGGQRARSNLVNVDGADATDNSVNGVRSTVSQEAVQEFQIINNSYAAEYGRASGGVVNIITRSGSNDFHGDVFGYLRNRDFQAVNPFSTVSNPAYTRVQAGAAFGGPIKKDKTYFYFSYETTHRHETGFSSIGLTPNNFGLVNNVDISAAFGLPPGSIPFVSGTPAQQAYFANLPNALGQIAATLGSGAAQAYAQEAALYGTWVGGSSGIAVHGTYPVAAFTPLVGLGVVPTPINGTSPFTQFPSSCTLATPNLLCNGLPSSFLTLQSQSGNFPVFEDTNLYSLRLDHNLTNNNHITLRANVSPSTLNGIEVNGQNQPFGQNAYSRTSQQSYHDVAGVFQDTWTIGNNKVNEFRFQYARRSLDYFYNKSISAGLDPAVNIIGTAYIGREPYSFIQRVEQRYQFSDNFSWTFGRHNTKFGVDFNYLPVDATFTVNYGGVYNFSGLSGLFPNACSPVCPNFPDFSSVQAYGLGIPSYVVQGIGSPKDSFSNKPLGVFFQDSFRATSKLTLNLGVRYDVEFPPQFAPPTGLAASGYKFLGIQKGIQTDTNNIQPRIGFAFDPKGDGKTVFRGSYGIFYDHPLLGLYFLGDASDGSKTGQLLFFGSNPCDGTSPSPLNLNATNTFQGILGASGCLPPGLATALGYQNNSAAGSACGGGPNPQRFDPCLPNSPFLNQSYLTGPNPFPLISQPFGYPQANNFVYAYSQQVNFTFEKDLGNGLVVDLAYNFNGGHHLNRPINANTSRGDLLTANWQAALAAGAITSSTTPLGVASCGPNPIPGAKLPFFVPSPLVSFFRPSGLNPSLAGGAFAPCVPLAIADLQAARLNTGCNPLATGLNNCVPFSDMDANYSNGSSVYHGFTASVRKRFSGHYEFFGSYTWSHAIDDSTDLQSTLTPQDSYFPNNDRSTSLFDQRHRLVFSGVYQSGRLAGDSFVSKLFSNWTIAPIIEVSSGRPFNLLTGSGDNFQFSSTTGRPNVVPAGTPTNMCGFATVASKYSPTGFLQEPCFADLTPLQLAQPNALLLLDGNLGRNAGITPWTVFNDLRIAKSIPIRERIHLEGIVDIFNMVNRYNVAAVNPLFTVAGQATAAYDPRQFQFALKVLW